MRDMCEGERDRYRGGSIAVTKLYVIVMVYFSLEFVP